MPAIPSNINPTPIRNDNSSDELPRKSIPKNPPIIIKPIEIEKLGFLEYLPTLVIFLIW